MRCQTGAIFLGELRVRLNTKTKIMYRRKNKLLACGLMMLIGYLHAQEAPVQLESPYYIFPRGGAHHIDLGTDWLLTSAEDTIRNPEDLKDNKWFNVAYPTSVQMANYHSGKLGNPYAHRNALEHEKLEQKAWYYKKASMQKNSSQVRVHCCVLMVSITLPKYGLTGSS